MALTSLPPVASGFTQCLIYQRTLNWVRRETAVPETSSAGSKVLGTSTAPGLGKGRKQQCIELIKNLVSVEAGKNYTGWNMF